MSNPKAKKRLELIYIIAGKETLVNAECDKLLGELIEPQQRTMGLFKAEGSEVSASDVLDEVRTAPFLTVETSCSCKERRQIRF